MTKYINGFKGTTAALALFLAGAAVAVPTVAHADRKTTPATECKIWGGHKAYANSITYSQFGFVGNTHATKRIGVVCPILRDNTGAAPNWIQVWIKDKHYNGGSTGSLRCRVRANTVWGDASTDSQVIFTNESGGRYNFGFTYHNIDNVANKGNYTVLCLIPPLDPTTGATSFVGSIVIDEP